MRTIIVGGGQVGSYVARILIDAGRDVRVVEYREKPLAGLKNELPPEVIVNGDGADPKVLEQAGINDADVVAAVTGADEINLVTATIAKFEFGVDKVIARINNPKNTWLFTEEMGVDVRVSQAYLIANVITDQIDFRNLTTLMRLNRGNNAIVQVTVGDGAQADGKPLREIKVPEGTVVINVRRGEANLVAGADTVITKGDSVLVYTRTVNEEEINTIFR
ncbi:potassium channel family protein [Schleiferilactobacillus harbinensis]|uniref:potassium channel family protein n=1 Tax=Schleiferilactobacillus harbinensis TaxID=304207 RepID=UPI001172091F|nr:TrkA family potassium uptake protein [Schleiferilactobacillus harbinensis]GEK06247.1 potassium transporter TrkB [Schleiferilactobacillus harbinensis]